MPSPVPRRATAAAGVTRKPATRVKLGSKAVTDVASCDSYWAKKTWKRNDYNRNIILDKFEQSRLLPRGEKYRTNRRRQGNQDIRGRRHTCHGSPLGGHSVIGVEKRAPYQVLAKRPSTSIPPRVKENLAQTTATLLGHKKMLPLGHLFSSLTIGPRRTTTLQSDLRQETHSLSLPAQRLLLTSQCWDDESYDRGTTHFWSHFFL